MGYFDNCRPDQRFTLGRKTYRNGSLWVVHDWDQRRTVAVSTSWVEDDEDFIFEALAELIDDLPADAVLIQVSQDGELLSSSSNIDDDPTMIPFYPLAADFPQELHRVRRSDLTEIDRLGVQADLTTYKSILGPIKHVAFKYYLNQTNTAIFWHEINCVLRIPKHPNIVQFDSLVVDTVDSKDIVVGFTTHFISGGTVLDNVSRVFKLKYLKQLIEVVNYINLKLGIVHGDICPWNLLINPETDDLQIFDFNLSAKLGWEGDIQNNGAFGYDVDRNDVKLVVFTLYEIITRDLRFRKEYYPNEFDSSVVLEMDTWKRHAEVRLDSPVSDYRRVLEEWVNTRKKVDKEITHYSQAPDALDWPPLPEFPLVPFVGSMMRRPAQMRQDMIRRGAEFLRWQRPGSSGGKVGHGIRNLPEAKCFDLVPSCGKTFLGAMLNLYSYALAENSHNYASASRRGGADAEYVHLSFMAATRLLHLACSFPEEVRLGTLHMRYCAIYAVLFLLRISRSSHQHLIDEAAAQNATSQTWAMLKKCSEVEGDSLTRFCATFEFVSKAGWSKDAPIPTRSRMGGTFGIDILILGAARHKKEAQEKQVQNLDEFQMDGEINSGDFLSQCLDWTDTNFANHDPAVLVAEFHALFGAYDFP